MLFSRSVRHLDMQQVNLRTSLHLNSKSTMVMMMVVRRDQRYCFTTSKKSPHEVSAITHDVCPFIGDDSPCFSVIWVWLNLIAKQRDVDDHVHGFICLAIRGYRNRKWHFFYLRKKCNFLRIAGFQSISWDSEDKDTGPSWLVGTKHVI